MKTKSLSSLFLLATCLLFSIHQVTAQVFGDVSLPENTFTLGDFLDVYYQFNDDNTFTMAIRCNRPNQYFGLGLGTAMAGADIWAFQIISSEVTVNDYYATRATTPTLDTRRNGNDDLTRLGYEITSEYTLVKFTRALDTGDANDHALAPGLTNFIYATGNSPTLAYHGSSRTNRGEAQIELLDSTGEAPVEEENSSEITPVTFGDVTPLPNTTPVGDFLMFSYEFNDDNTITMVINCTIPNQFFGFGLGTSMIGADIWVFEIINSEVVASDYTSNEQGPPTLDTDNQGENDLETLGYEINPSYTLIKIRRSLSTGDSNDLEILPGPTDVIFATAPYQTLAYHDGQRGIAQINLIRDTPVEEEEEDEPQEAEEEATETEEPQEEEEEATRDEEPTGTEEEPIETNDPQEEETTGDNGSNITFGDVSAPQNSVNVGDFLTINYEMNDDDSVTMLIRCSIPNQFFGLGFGESMRDSDIWLFQIVNSEVTVEDCYSNDYVPPILDTEAENPGNSDLVRLGYEITPTYTLVKVRRALNTNDAHDKVIRLGRNYVIYATTDSPTVDYHGDRRGSTSIILLENPSDSGEPNDVEDITTEDDTPGKWGDTELPQDFFNVAGLLTIYFEFTRDGYITIALRCNSPNQFFGIGFGSVMTGTDMWVFEINDEGVTATDYKGLTEGPPTRDTDLGGKQDLELLGFEVASTYTLVKVRRLLDTGDANDFILYEGWVDMIYATAPTRFLSKHPSGDRGMVTVPFIEGTKGYTLLDASSDPRDIHGILNIIAWGVLVDIGIIAARVLRGRKFTFGSIIISAQLIHSAIMWLVFIMSMTVTGMMLNKNRSVRGSKLTEDTVENFQLINTHFILGLLLMFLSLMTVVVGVANMLYLRSYQKAPPAGFNIKKMHKVLGFLMYAGAKANIIIGAIFHNDGAWMIPVYIYLFVLLVIHVFIQKKYKDGFRFSNKVRSITQKASRKPRHVALMAAINNGSPREKLLLEFPHIKWVQVGNKVYDLTDWTHPGGNYIIQACTGREVGRFLYGNYALESANFKPHKHSALALSQLNHFYIGEVNNYESILLSKNGTHETFSRVTHDWRIASRNPVSDTVTQVNFVNNEIKVKNFGASLTWLGRHFQVSFAKKNSHARLYTIALSLNEANIALRRNLYQYFDDIMAGEDACFEFDSSYLDPEDTLPIFIKNYYQVNGLSRAIHAADIESPNCNFRIEGPISRGMELGHANSGTQTIICAGTGLLPFVDFLNFFLWKNMYDLIKRKAGKGKAQEMNILNIPFENYMNGLRINFIGSFANESEILGLDIIKKLAEISTKYETFNFNAMIKGYSDENIIEVKESFNTEFLRKHVSLTEERFYVVGPPRLNKQVPDSLVKIGVSQERIILV